MNINCKKRLFLFLAFCLCNANSLWAQYESNSGLLFPINLSPSFSANFGELRKNHFHSGVDIRTNAEIGHPVYVIADGFVARIFVSPYGFGNALYIDHPDGTTSVYGHLDRFSEAIDAYVRKRQYINESYAINDFPNKSFFPVKKGDIIAYSGNAGSSGGPHLHFEIRDTKSSEIMNPLDKRFFSVSDNIPPKIKSFVIYSIDTIRGIPVYSIAKEIKQPSQVQDTILVPFGFAVGLELADYMPNSKNEYFIQKATASLDGKQYFSFDLKRFAFNETRYVNSSIDYALFYSSKREVLKTYKEPNNRFSALAAIKPNRHIILRDTLVHHLSATAEDVNGNITDISVAIKASSNIQRKPVKISGIPMYIAKNNVHKTESSRIEISGNALYSDQFVQYREIAGKSEYSPTIIVGSKTQPLQKSFKIAIKANIPAALAEKAYIARGTSKSSSFLGGSYGNGYLTASSGEFGSFFVDVDNTAPTIRCPMLKVKRIKGNKIHFTVTDDKTGIENCDAYIDNKWAIAEYDFKRAQVHVFVDENLFEKGKEHVVELYVADGVGNTNYFRSTFIF